MSKEKDYKKTDSGIFLPQNDVKNTSSFKLLDCFDEIHEISNRLAQQQFSARDCTELEKELSFKLGVFKHNLSQMDNFVTNCRCQSIEKVSLN